MLRQIDNIGPLVAVLQRFREFEARKGVLRKKMFDTRLACFYAQVMELRLSPERQAQLNDYASRHGQDPSTALDEVLGAPLENEHQDYQQAIEGIRRGYESMKAGRTRPVAEFMAELRGRFFVCCGN